MAGRTRKAITRISAFWDASILVPLCVRQTTTSRAAALYQSHDVVVWWGTPVEIASALGRLVRMKQLDTNDWTKARSLAARLADSWSVIQPSDILRNKAMYLVEHYDLRAADSFQLAAALEWCESNPKGRVFFSTDQKLREAASVIGFNAPTI